MSDSRRVIFSRLKQASKQNIQEIDKYRASFNKHLFQHERGVMPAYSENKLVRFITKLEKAAATVKCIKDTSELSAAVYDYLITNNIDTNIIAAPSETLKQVNWQKDISVKYRAALDQDKSTVTMAFAAIAETGSLILCSGNNSPTSLNFLPDNNICVIHQEKIYPYMEDVWDLLRNSNKKMPRAINFITGPSRTADVEQTIQLGAHGPRRLHVIILEDY